MQGRAGDAGGGAGLAGLLAPLDALRRAQGRTLDWLGYGPREHPHDVIAEGRLWRLRRYRGGGRGPRVLIVPAPIKRPYVWDLTPEVSAVGACLERGFDLHMLDWVPPAPGDRAVGLEAYAVEALGEALAATRGDGPAPAVLGHSLGGAFVVMHAALRPEAMARAVALGAPLCFGPGKGLFGAELGAAAQLLLRDGDLTPGAAASLAAAAAAPAGFLWSRLSDAAAAGGDPRRMDLLMRVERWTMEETPLSARLLREVLERLYRRDQLFRGVLRMGGGVAGPSGVRIPLLGVAVQGDPVAPPAAMAPFLAAVPEGRGRFIAFPGEAGTGLPHLSLLVGPRARRELWPRLLDWTAGGDAAAGGVDLRHGPAVAAPSMIPPDAPRERGRGHGDEG